MKIFKDRLWIGLGVGLVLGMATSSSDKLMAQARTSLSTLQTQINNIISGDQVVGYADEASFAAVAGQADDSNSLGGILAADYLTSATAAATFRSQSSPVAWSSLSGVPSGFADGVDNEGSYVAGQGMTLSANVFSVSNSYFDSRYLPLTGGTVSGSLFAGGSISSNGSITSTGNVSSGGNVISTGFVRPGGSSAASDSSNYGAIRWTGTALQVSTPTGWRNITLQ